MVTAIPLCDALRTCKLTIDTNHFETNINAILEASQNLLNVQYSPVENPLGMFYGKIIKGMMVTTFADVGQKSALCEQNGQLFQPNSKLELERMLLILNDYAVIFPVVKRNGQYLSNNLELVFQNEEENTPFAYAHIKAVDEDLVILGLTGEEGLPSKTVLICQYTLRFDDRMSIELNSKKINLVDAKTNFFQNLTKQFENLNIPFTFENNTVSMPTTKEKNCFPFSWELFEYHPVEVPRYCTPGNFEKVMTSFLQINKIFASVQKALTAAQDSDFNLLQIAKKAQSFMDFFASMFEGDFQGVTILVLFITSLVMSVCCCCCTSLILIAVRKSTRRRDRRILQTRALEAESML